MMCVVYFDQRTHACLLSSKMIKAFENYEKIHNRCALNFTLAKKTLLPTPSTTWDSKRLILYLPN